MLTQSIRLGRILGIPIGVNYSWFIIFVLLTHSLALRFGELHPDLTYGSGLAVGLVASLLFFSSVLLHELGHSVMALRYGIPVRSITLFVFGGVAEIGREPEKPTQDVVIAVAGPLVSAALGALFLAVQWLTLGRVEGLATLGGWLGGVNLTLAVFNLLPGFPLDGGRMLRGVVWRLTGSFERATRIASNSGRVVAFGFILLGVIQMLAGDLLAGLWIAFIGWFLLSAAQASAAQAEPHPALPGVTAADAHQATLLPASPTGGAACPPARAS